jgi:hypothetical protein
MGIASSPGNEISKCLHRAGDQRPNRDQHGRGGDGRNRGEVLLRIVTERLVDVRVKSHRYGRRQHHDRPVRGRLCVGLRQERVNQSNRGEAVSLLTHYIRAGCGRRTEQRSALCDVSLRRC